MVRDFINQKIKTVIHFDGDFKVTKIARNNVERIRHERHASTNNTLIAILDSGLDYNHPGIASNLLPPVYDEQDILRYEESKNHFINDLKITSELEKRLTTLLRELELSQTTLKYGESKLNLAIAQRNELQSNRNVLNFAIQKDTRLIKILKDIVGDLENDKLLIFKSEKQKKIREHKSKIRTLEYQKTSNASDVSRLDRQIIEKEKSIDRFRGEFLKKEEEFKEIQRQEQDIQNEISQHKEMLAIFTKSVTAWNFHDDNDTPSDFWDGISSILYQNYDHGTHVGGIIADKTSELSLFPMRYPEQSMFDFYGTKDNKIYQAIWLAHAKGARIINISMGTLTPESFLESGKEENQNPARQSWQGLERAIKDFPDMLFVCAAGNDGVDSDTTPHYPSSFEYDNVLSVAAVDKNNVLASFSNFGTKTVDIAAPGVDIASLTPGGEVGIKSGTSMAAPYISRVAGKIKHINPELSPREIIEIIAKTATRTTELRGKVRFSGAVDEAKAVKMACEGADSPIELCQ
jgi:subtilisin family serine protease